MVFIICFDLVKIEIKNFLIKNKLYMSTYLLEIFFCLRRSKNLFLLKVQSEQKNY